MKNNIYLLFVLFTLVILFILINPFYLNEFMNSLIGKLICVVLIIYFSFQNKFSGLLVAFLFICFIETLQAKEAFSFLGEGKKAIPPETAEEKHRQYKEKVKADKKAAKRKKDMERDDRIYKRKMKKEAAKLKAEAPAKALEAKAKAKKAWRDAGPDAKKAAEKAIADQKSLTAYIKNIYNKQFQKSYAQDLQDEAKKIAITTSLKQAKLQTAASLI